MAASVGAEFKRVEKSSRLRDRHRADFGDRFSGDAHGARFRAQPRAVAIRADGVAAIAAQKNAHVQLVFFPLEPGERSLSRR